MASVVYFRFLFECRFKAHGQTFLIIICCHLSGMYLPWLLPHFSVMFTSLPLTLTEKNLNNDHTFSCRVPHRFMCPAGVVYSFALGRFHTECVGEKTYCESKKEVDGKTPKTQPMKIDSWISWHIWSDFVIWQNSKAKTKTKQWNAWAVTRAWLHGEFQPRLKFQSG